MKTLSQLKKSRQNKEMVQAIEGMVGNEYDVKTDSVDDNSLSVIVPTSFLVIFFIGFLIIASLIGVDYYSYANGNGIHLQMVITLFCIVWCIAEGCAWTLSIKKKKRR